MFGEGGDVRGVIPRSVEYLFSCLAKKTSTSEVAMVCSFLEIYNDQIRDLGKAYLAAMGVESNTSAAMHEKTSDLFEKLAGKRGNPYFAPAFHKAGSAIALSGSIRPGLKEVQDEYNTMNYEIREDNEGNVFVKDLSLVPVTTMDEVMSLIATGLRVRATHETKMNATSSRSHTVFTITVLQRDKITGEAITGMLNLVDLAGSERIKKSESIGIRLKEALHINTSLTALGKVIMALDPASENSHIPYRDSKLTRVLQNSLGGNSYTTVIATIQPIERYYDECLSSLQFANRCRNVKNNPKVNYLEDTEDKDRKIKKLMEEINLLRNKMTGGINNLQNINNSQFLNNNNTNSSNKNNINMNFIMNILKKLNINAIISPDGSLLVNGQKINIEELININTDSNNDITTTTTNNSSNKDNTIEKLNKIIKELKETNSNYSIKSKERKLLIEEQGKQINKLTIDLIKLQTGIRHKEYECKGLIDDKTNSLNEMKIFLEKKYQNDLENMIQHNKELMNIHQSEIDKIPLSLLEYTTLYNKNEKEKKEIEEPLKFEFQNTLLNIDKSRINEINHIKLQYNYYLEEKDKALNNFVDEFNQYRTKKSEQLRMAEQEIVKLYDYFMALETILNETQKGKYYFKTRDPISGLYPEFRINNMEEMELKIDELNNYHNSNNNSYNNLIHNNPNTNIGIVKGALILPKDEIPINPFKEYGASTLALTKKIVEKHKERTDRLKKMKLDAIEKSVHYANVHDRTKKSEHRNLKDNVRNFLGTSTSNKQNNNTGGNSSGKTEVVFSTATGGMRPQSAGVNLVRSLPAGGPKLPPARPATSHHPPRGSKEAFNAVTGAATLQQGSHSSFYSNPATADGGVTAAGSGIAAAHAAGGRGGGGGHLRQGLCTAPSVMQSKLNLHHGDSVDWDNTQPSPTSPKTATKHTTSAALLEKQVKEMAQEIERLRLSEQRAKVISDSLFKVILQYVNLDIY